MQEIIGSDQAGAVADVVKDATTESFASDVIDASREVPVIVDLWAPWCGPCKQLGPVIEKAVRAAGGKVRLVKLNIDENPDIAQQLQVKSIPAVFAFRNGQPIDGFVGALPESQIKRFVEGLTGAAGPSPVEQAIEQAKTALEAGEHGQARTILGEILKREPDNLAVIGDLARCHVMLGELDQARALIEPLDEEARKTSEVAGALAALGLAEQSGEAGADRAELESRLEANPKDHQARLDLAMALYGADQREAAVDQLLEIVERARNWNDQAARNQLLKFFDAFGPDDALTQSARRRLSSILFS